MAAPHVFLSHSSKDIAFTQRLETDLWASGATVYRVSADQGGDFQRRIDEALMACDWVVLVLTSDALASPWVQQEIYAANRLRHDGRIKNILPIQAGAVDYRAIPPLWGVYNIFDASRDYAVGRDSLLRALGLAAPAAQPPAPPVGARPAAPAPAVPAAPAIPADRFPARLAQLGFVARKSGSVEYIVPPVASVPAGEFLMGSDPKKDSGAFSDEQPQHRVTLPSFQTARFPVTVAEYACFVHSGHAEPKNTYGDLDWKMQLQQVDHPVVYISWRDAVAYTAWLANLTGRPWRLPSEAEWEKAARWDGRSARIYPWGDSFDKTRCNTSEGGKGTTTPMGTYAERSDASPYGAHDLAGNIWELTCSIFKSYPYTPRDGCDVLNSAKSRVMRGGSWSNDARFVRAAYRTSLGPGDAHGLVGFRIVLAVPNS